MIELTSASSAAGKTNLLYFIAAKAVLPKSYRGVELGASHAAVVFIDTNGQFDADRLLVVALGIVIQEAKNQGVDISTGPSDLSQLQDLVVESLKHVHVFRPRSSAELLTVLYHLPGYLLQTDDETSLVMPEHHSKSRPVHSLLIDSASAFYYQDARAHEINRLVIAGNRIREEAADPVFTELQPDIDISTTASASDLVSYLRHIQKTFECSVVFTTWGLYPRVSRNATSQFHGNGNRVSSWAGRTVNITSFKSYLPAAWLTYPTCRLILRRESVKQFPPDLSLETLVPSSPRPDDGEDADADHIRQLARERQSAVQATGFIASLDNAYIGNSNDIAAISSSSSGPPSSIRFRITKFGVCFDE